MPQQILEALFDIPQYVNGVAHGPHAAIAIIAGLVYLVVLLVTNKVTRVLREIFVAAGLVVGVIAYFRRNYPLMWICVLIILLLGIFRFIRYLIVTIRTNRRNRRIEERALEKARNRRGSFRNRQGYSGEARPETDEEIDQLDRDLSSSDSEAEGSASPGDASDDGEADEFSDQLPDRSLGLSHREVMEAIDMLHKLRDMGVLTEAECNAKAARLYEARVICSIPRYFSVAFNFDIRYNIFCV